MRKLAYMTFASITGLVLGGCPRPTDGEPQIAISPGLEDRIRLAHGRGFPVAGIAPTTTLARELPRR